MKRVGFQFKVRGDLLEEYKEHHKHADLDGIIIHYLYDQMA
jgi:L-rhamnose mutarotase